MNHKSSLSGYVLLAFMQLDRTLNRCEFKGKGDIMML